MGIIHTVYILADRILRHGYTIQHIRIFHDHGNCFIGNILGNCCRNVFLITVQTHGIADRYHLQQLFFCITAAHDKIRIPVIRIQIFSDRKFLCPCQIGNHLFCRSSTLCIFQIFCLGLSIYIRQKTQQRFPFHRKGILIIFIQNNIKIIDDLIIVFFYHINQPGDCPVQLCIFCPAGLIYIFYRNGVRQLIICHKLSVTVINIASCTGNGTFLSDLQFKTVQIFFPMNDLKRKEAIDQDT